MYKLPEKKKEKEKSDAINFRVESLRNKDMETRESKRLSKAASLTEPQL